MRMLTHVPVVALLLLGLGGQAIAFPADKPAVRLEFRRAELKPGKGLKKMTVPESKQKVYVHPTGEVTNEDIAAASVGKDFGGEIALELKFTKRGGDKLRKMTKEHQGKPLAILLDGKLLTAPIIREPLGERAVVSGMKMEEVTRFLSGWKARK